jgi:hypothetical protein
MASQTEYVAQRDGVTYWVGYARGRGINVELHSALPIFNRPRYGYDGLIYQESKSYQARADELRMAMHKSVDFMAEAEYKLRRAWNETERMADAISEAQQAYLTRGMIDGCTREIMRYSEKVEAMTNATGHAIIDRNEFESALAAHGKLVPVKEAEMHVARGRLEFALGLWKAKPDDPRMTEQAKKFMKDFLEACAAAGFEAGSRDENIRLKANYDEKLTAAGGQHSLDAVKEQQK